MSAKTLTTLLTGVVLGVSATLTGNVLADGQGAATKQSADVETNALPWEEARLLAEVLERVKREYVDSIDDHELLENAVRGMVAALDPHSAFLDSEEYEEIRVSTMGSYPGVGIEVAASDGAVKILRTIEGSPAANAGLRAGDLIVKIDDAEIGTDLEGAIARMRGRAGSTVKLVVRRPGETGELLSYSLQRARVAVRSVSQQSLEPGYGYLRITTFSETTAEDVSRAVAQMKRANPAGIQGLVLDLRNNPGGVLEAGVAVADAFLEEGVIVTADGRTEDARFRMDATPGDLVDGAPIVVLVNSGSASASEILAGALKDHGRASLVGHKTYGKGSVQTVMPLARGGAVKLTTSRYFTPSGASIHERGIVPDVKIDGPESRPAELDTGKSAGSLASRDHEVAVALDALKAKTLAVAASG
jgi:carboxyl-terminal processing protease